ncbi:hydrogenase expression/formation protein [Magnetospira thiophila]
MERFDWPEDETPTTFIPVLGETAGDGLLSVMDKARSRTLDLSAAEDLARDCPMALSLLQTLADQLAIQTADEPPFSVDLMNYPEKDRLLIDQVLGEGEVSGVILGDGAETRIQESVMAGLWRVRRVAADGRLLADGVEIAAVPGAARAAADGCLRPPFAIGAAPEGAMNALPLLHEVRERARAYRAGQPNHVISFTLLPMSEPDMDFLRATLGTGGLRLLSKGYGTCQVLATGVRHVWSVQFLNVMGDVVLDTLEVGDVPVAVLATGEDFEDSAERLREIRDAYL